MERFMFQRSTQVIVLLYNTSSKASFRNMKAIFDRIPPPGYDPGQYDEHCPVSMQQDEKRKIILKPEASSGSNEVITSVLAKRFPVVLADYTPLDVPREVEHAEVKRFIQNQTGCVSAVNLT